MSAHSHDRIAPPGAVFAAAMLVLLSLVLVVAVRSNLLPAAQNPASVRAAAHLAPVRERSLRFSDRADGAVLIDNAVTGERIDAIGSEGSGFIRGVMRGLARDRRQRGIGAAAPFRLALWPNGALSLTDTATGRIIELNGFGPDNRAAFARLLGISDGGVAL